MADKRREDDYTFKLLVEGPDDRYSSFKRIESFGG